MSNPPSPDFTYCDRSAGGAAAVASGMSLLHIGTDLGCSLRIQAAWCDNTSLLISEGVGTGDRTPPSTHDLDHFARMGPIAWRVDELALITSLLRENDGAQIKHL